jgi:hypothetical protein
MRKVMMELKRYAEASKTMKGVIRDRGMIIAEKVSKKHALRRFREMCSLRKA